MLEQRQINILVAYRDKSYVYAALLESSYEFFSLIKSLCNIPLILITSVLSILNASDFDSKEMKLPNTVINACVAMIIALISNFRLSEKEVLFKQVQQKIIRHCHNIEDMLNNNLESLVSEDVSEVIKKYDDIVEMNDYTFPSHIKRKITKIYKGKRSLPAVLNCVEVNFTNSNPSTPSATANMFTIPEV
jgi:predicted GTPase